MKLLDKYYLCKRFLRHKSEVDGEYEIQRKANEGKQIQFYNWWPEDSHSMWLQDFIIKRGLLKDSTKTVALCSVFGEKEVLGRVDADVRIFFSGENLHHDHMSQYADYMLSGSRPFDLGLGFDYFDNKKYMRFPLWITFLFEPDSSDDEIRSRCKQLRYPQIGDRNRFCAMIARADWLGIRKDIMMGLSQIEEIACPSTLFHNDDSLKENFCDDKLSYLKKFEFNICPENSDACGYTTEKVFEAIAAGCIPIYWGSYGNPEPEVLNKDAILFWDKSGHSESLIDFVKRLHDNKEAMISFSQKPRLIESAEDVIIDYYHQLEKHISGLL